jgi:hypothetical protein
MTTTSTLLSSLPSPTMLPIQPGRPLRASSHFALL